jgi:SAM-dependent methyltransferase
MNDTEIKKEVKKKYGELVVKNESCCGPTNTSCCGEVNEWSMTDDKYSELKGYNPDADLKLGCGMPTEFAGINEGDTVVDLGSGAGNDVFIARALTGENGKVIGLDFTEEMIGKARKNNEKMGYDNVSFVYGEIEDMPIEDNTADVVLSNCVMNLVPDKTKAFAEMYRITKPGGHFSVSDIVTGFPMPEKLQEQAALYAGCISGAVTKEEYIHIIEEAGYKNVRIDSEKEIKLPYGLIEKYLSDEEINEYKKKGKMVISVNVYGEKK